MHSMHLFAWQFMVISSFLFGTALVWHTGRKQNVERISFSLLFALAHVMMWLKFNDKLQFREQLTLPNAE